MKFVLKEDSQGPPGKTRLPQRDVEDWWAEVFAGSVFNPIIFPFLVKMEGAFNFNDIIFKNPIWLKPVWLNG